MSEPSPLTNLLGNPLIIVALITAVVGPVLTILVTSTVSKQRAQKKVGFPSQGFERDAGTNVLNIILGLTENHGKRIDALTKNITALNGELVDLRDKLRHLERENTRLRFHNRLLTNQLSALGEVPVEMPE